MTRRDALIPAGKLADIVRALYADAERLDWEHLPLPQRTAQYGRWVTDPAVGGVLTRFMTSEQARSWIKDGPLKEFTRARRGTGRYAQYGQPGGTGPIDVVRAALGDGWAIVPGSVGVKPSHCRAERHADRAYLVWGKAANFRHLVWAALRYVVDEPGQVIVVVTELAERPTPRDEVDWHKRVTQRCGLRIVHMREHLASSESHRVEEA